MTEVLLVGYQDQGNLGMGYLASVLDEHGHSVELIDVRDGPEAVAARVRESQPLVVGFSLIFQFFLPQFRDVAALLRAQGVTAHFTIGGHYASLCPDEVLAQMPELDSVARYEGEATLVDLVEHLASGRDWHEVRGLAFFGAGEDRAMAESPPRELVQDLDTLPFPYRPYDPELILGFKTMPLLASRGCARRCSFCSIHTFYRTAPGKVVRIRARRTCRRRDAHALSTSEGCASSCSRTTTSRCGAGRGQVGRPSRRTPPRVRAGRQDALEDQLSRGVRRARALRAACGTPASTWSTWASSPGSRLVSRSCTSR